jgi:hypothetical protein
MAAPIRFSRWFASVQVDTCPTMDRRSAWELIECLLILGSAWDGLTVTFLERLPSRDLAGPDDTRRFHHLKLSAHNERIVTDLRFVDESNRRIRAAARRNGIVGTIDELHTQIFAVAMTDSKMGTVMSWTIGRKANGRPSPAFVCGQELDQDLGESCNAYLSPSVPVKLPGPPGKTLTPVRYECDCRSDRGGGQAPSVTPARSIIIVGPFRFVAPQEVDERRHAGPHDHDGCNGNDSGEYQPDACHFHFPTARAGVWR